MKTTHLIIPVGTLGIEDAEVKGALASLKRLGAVLSYRREREIIRLVIDPVRAELLMQTFFAAVPLAEPIRRKRATA